MADKIKYVSGKIGAPTKYFAPMGASSSFFDAVSSQVRADWEMTKLDTKKSAGKLSDKEYIKGLQKLQKNYAKGTGLRQSVHEKVLTGAQEIAENYRQERMNMQEKATDEAQMTWNTALEQYALGEITSAQLAQVKNYYLSATTTSAKIPSEQKLVRKITGGKFWDQYKSGKMRNIKREKQIKNLYNQANYSEVGRTQIPSLKVGKYAGSEMSIDTIRQLMEYNKMMRENKKK